MAKNSTVQACVTVLVLSFLIYIAINQVIDIHNFIHSMPGEDKVFISNISNYAFNSFIVIFISLFYVITYNMPATKDRCFSEMFGIAISVAILCVISMTLIQSVIGVVFAASPIID